MIRLVVFSLSGAYFFFLGWYFYLLCKLWGTVEYGGKIYTGALLRIFALTALISLAHLIAEQGRVPEDIVDSYFLSSALLFPLGWFTRLWQYRKNGK